MGRRGGPLGSGAAGGVVGGAGGGVPRVRQAVVTAAAGRLLVTGEMGAGAGTTATAAEGRAAGRNKSIGSGDVGAERSEEHTSELQAQSNLVWRLLLGKKKKQPYNTTT